MLLTVVSLKQFQARQANPGVGFTVDKEGCNPGHYYLTKNDTGADTLVMHTESNACSIDDLFAARLQVAVASGDQALVAKVAAMKSNSGTLTAYPILLVGVANYQADGLHAQFSVNLFQVFKSKVYLNDSGDFSHANINAFVPMNLPDGSISPTYAAISAWHQAAQDDDAVRANGDVNVANKLEDGSWKSTGHSQMYLLPEEMSFIAFNLMQGADGSFLTEPADINGKISKVYKVKNTKLRGIFNFQNVAGSRRLMTEDFDELENDMLSVFESVVPVAVPSVSTSPTTQVEVVPPTTTKLDANAMNLLSLANKNGRPKH